MVVVWSTNHFYYNGELFSRLRHSSLEAIILPPVLPNVIKLRKTGSHRNVGFSFFVINLEKHLTKSVKCAAFLLITISKKARVIRGNPTPNYKEALA